MLAFRPTYRPLVLVAAAVAAGICVDRFSAGTPLYAAISWWCTSLGLLVVWWTLRRNWPGQTSNHIQAVILLASAAAAGGAWHHAHWNLYADHEVARFATATSQPICLRGLVTTQPRIAPAPPESPYRAIPAGDRTELIIDVRGIRDGRAWIEASGVAQLRVNGHLLDVQVGDRICVFADIYRPGPPANPGDFDFAQYLRQDRQLCGLSTGFPECVDVQQRAALWRTPSLWLDALQRHCEQPLAHYLNAEQYRIAAALLLGKRENLTRRQTEAYFETGTIHLLVVSGLHVGMLAALVYALCRWMIASRRAALWLTAVVVVVFALVTGARPPVVRATVLTLATLLGLGAGRPAWGMNPLAAAALVVMCYNPATIFRSGTQLSFLAVATLIWYGHWMRRHPRDELDAIIVESQSQFVRIGKRAWWSLMRLMEGTFYVWLVALPLVTSAFHIVTPIALLLSPVMWLLTWACLATGFLLIGVGWVGQTLAQSAAGLLGWSVDGLDGIVTWAAMVPGGHFWVPAPPMWWVMATYTGLALVRCGANPVNRFGRRWIWSFWSLWVGVALLPALLPESPEQPTLQCTFLAVGHGTCVVLHLPDDRTVLYDAGNLGSPESAGASISEYLWSEWVGHIDAVVLSHADLDHFSAVPFLLSRFSVGEVLVSPVMFDPIFQPRAESPPRLLQQCLQHLDIPIEQVYRGDALRIGELVRGEVLHPPEQGIIGTDNINSVVLSVEFAGWRILLPGDLEGPGMEAVMAELPHDVDVLLAPHHGSRFSNPPGFGQWCSPEYVAISGGRSSVARSAQVIADYRRGGAQVLHTATHGAIRVTLTPDNLRWEHFDGRHWQEAHAPGAR